MGIVWPTIPLSVKTEAEEGPGAGQLSSTILMDYLRGRDRRGSRGSESRTRGRRVDFSNQDSWALVTVTVSAPLEARGGDSGTPFARRLQAG
jgi:hypothetical protein